MKRLLFTFLFALLLSSVASAQFRTRIGGTDTAPVDHSLDQLVAAREKLINRYVLGNHMAWGVSVSGGEDMFTGEDSSWLTVYLYKDSLLDFAADFDKYATKTKHGTLQVDGITVVVEVIQRPKKTGAENEHPINGTQPAVGKHQDRGSYVQGIRRAS